MRWARILDGVADEDDDPCEEQLLDVEVGGGDELGPCDVACCKFGGVVEVSNDENLAVGIGEVLQLGKEGLGLAIGDGEGIDGEEFAIAGVVTEDAAESDFAGRFVNVLVVGAVARAEDNTTTDEDRSFPISVTGVAGSLLFIHFLAGSTDFTAGFGVCGAGAAVRTVCGDEVVDGLASLVFPEED